MPGASVPDPSATLGADPSATPGANPSAADPAQWDKTWVRSEEDQAIIETVAQSTRRALDDPAYLDRLVQLGVVFGTSESRQTEVMRGIARWLVSGRWEWMIMIGSDEVPVFVLMGKLA